MRSQFLALAVGMIVTAILSIIAFQLVNPSPADSAAGDTRIVNELRKLNSSARSIEASLMTINRNTAQTASDLGTIGVLDYGGVQLSELLYDICLATSGPDARATAC